MRQLNVSRLVRGPHTFIVHRSSGTFVEGKWTENATRQIPMKGTALPTDSRDIDQLPEGDRIKESRTFYTTERLYVTHADGVSAGTSDRVEFDGKLWRLMQVRDFTRFGYNKGVGVRIDVA